MGKDLEFAGNTIMLQGVAQVLPYPIKDAFAVGETVVVLYYDDAGDLKKCFHNLVALDQDGTPLWTAVLPDSEISVADRYIQVMSREPFVIYSWSGYDCTIDLATGRVVAQQFTRR